MRALAILSLLALLVVGCTTPPAASEPPTPAVELAPSPDAPTPAPTLAVTTPPTPDPELVDTPAAAERPAPTLAVTAPPTPDAATLVPPPAAGWERYVNNRYGFSFDYPASWELVQEDEHSLVLARDDYRLVLGFRSQSEDPELLQGMQPNSAGTFERSGSVTVLGQPVPREALIYEDRIKAVLYDTSDLDGGDLVLVLSLSSTAANYDAIDLLPGIQAEADAIVESLRATSET